MIVDDSRWKIYIFTPERFNNKQLDLCVTPIDNTDRYIQNESISPAMQCVFQQ